MNGPTAASCSSSTDVVPRFWTPCSPPSLSSVSTIVASLSVHNKNSLSYGFLIKQILKSNLDRKQSVRRSFYQSKLEIESKQTSNHVTNATDRKNDIFGVFRRFLPFFGVFWGSGHNVMGTIETGSSIRFRKCPYHFCSSNGLRGISDY